MLPFLVFVTLLSPPSSRFRQIAPGLTPLFSPPSATSVLKSPRNPVTQPAHSGDQPTRFPLFPHPVNIAHTPSPANPFSCTACSHFPSHRGVGAIDASLPLRSPLAPSSTLPPYSPTTPLNATLTKLSASVDSKQLTQPLNPLNATLTENSGGPPAIRMVPLPLGSLPLYFITSLPRFGYTISRHSP